MIYFTCRYLSNLLGNKFLFASENIDFENIDLVFPCDVSIIPFNPKFTGHIEFLNEYLFLNLEIRRISSSKLQCENSSSIPSRNSFGQRNILFYLCTMYLLRIWENPQSAKINRRDSIPLKYRVSIQESIRDK